MPNDLGGSPIERLAGDWLEACVAPDLADSGRARGEFLPLQPNSKPVPAARNNHDAKKNSQLRENEENIDMVSTIPRSNRRRVIIADPRSFMRGCLSCWLDEFGGEFQPVVVADATDAIDGGPLPAAAILSVPARPEERAWLEAQVASLRYAVPELPIILISDDGEMSSGQEAALALGLQGYVPMSSSVEVAAAALRLVIAGACYFPHAATSKADIVTLPRPNENPSRSIGGPPPAPPRPPGELYLTPREQAVFDLLAEGLPNKLIARRLSMALSTVKIHVHHIIEKLNVQNRTEVAIWGRAARATATHESAAAPVAGRMLVHEMQ